MSRGVIMRWKRAGKPTKGTGTIPKIISFFKKRGRVTTTELYEYLVGTSYETGTQSLQMILSRCGIFERVGTARKEYRRGGTYPVNVWSLKR